MKTYKLSTKIESQAYHRAFFRSPDTTLLTYVKNYVFAKENKNIFKEKKC